MKRPLDRQPTNDLDFEASCGLPEPLPAGERLLWQGAPEWRAMALRTFHLRKAALYFSVLLVWRVVSALREDQSLTSSLAAGLALLPYALAALSILALLARLTSRTTVYTITDRRVVVRIGIALPMTINIPFSKIATAGVKTFADGTGDIPLKLVASDRIAWLVLWPHCRPWHISQPEPMLRGLANVRGVAGILGEALRNASIAQAAPAVAATSSELYPAGLLPARVA